METLETALATSEKTLQDYISSHSTLKETLQSSKLQATQQEHLTTRQKLLDRDEISGLKEIINEKIKYQELYEKSIYNFIKNLASITQIENSPKVESILSDIKSNASLCWPNLDVYGKIVRLREALDGFYAEFDAYNKKMKQSRGLLLRQFSEKIS